MSATGVVVTIVAATVLVVAAIPVGRLAFDATLRRVFPRAWQVAVVGLVAWLVAVLVLAFVAPWLLWILAVPVGLVALVRGARARPTFGRSRGVPTGSLSFTRSIAGLADRSFYLSAMHRYGPVFKTAQFHRPTACVVGLDRGHRTLLDHADALVTPPLPFTRQIPGGFLRFMDPATHDVYGPLFRRAISPAIAETAREATAAATRRELDVLAAAGGGTPTVALQRLTFDGLARALVGIEPDTAAAEEFRTRTEALAHQDLSQPMSAATESSLGEARAFLLARVDGTPDASVVDSALGELRRLDPSLPDRTCLDNLLFTLRIATRNVSDLMHWLLARLGGDGDWAARLRADAVEGGERPDLRERFVLESLRLGQSEYLYRRTTADIDVDGHAIPAGWFLRVCVAESHRDAAVFDDPDRFDPDRFLLRRYTASEYSPLGFGRHACNGVALTHVTCHAFLTELVTGYDVSVTGGEQLERGFRHWLHWRPGSDLALHLTPVSR